MQPKTRKTEELEATFTELAEQWLKDTAFHSSSAPIVRHPAYQRIVELGEAALPLVFRELEQGPPMRVHWMHALRDITGVIPVPKELWGKVDIMTNIWLQWGREQGYQW